MGLPARNEAKEKPRQSGASVPMLRVIGRLAAYQGERQISRPVKPQSTPLVSVVNRQDKEGPALVWRAGPMETGGRLLCLLISVQTIPIQSGVNRQRKKAPPNWREGRGQ